MDANAKATLAAALPPLVALVIAYTGWVRLEHRPFLNSPFKPLLGTLLHEVIHPVPCSTLTNNLRWTFRPGTCPTYIRTG